MSSGLDASGSSSMGDIFQSFQNGGSNWGKRFEKQGARSVGRLTINGLGTDVTSAMVRAFLEPFYNTVQEVRLIPGRGGGMGGASVSFGFAAERDKATSELNGRELHGCRISVTKQADPVEPSAPQNRKRPLEDEIHDLLRQYQALRAHRDYRAADAILLDLKGRGVLVDPRSGTWRSDDGKTGMLPSLPAPVQRSGGKGGGKGGGGKGGGKGGPAAALDPAEEARLVCVRMGTDSSYGTSTLTKIFEPYHLEVVHPPRDGYATMVFESAAGAAEVLSLAHYTPTGKRLALLAARQLREIHAQATAASAAAAAAAAAAARAPALPAGWSCGWAAEHGCWYYCNAAQGVTQWEPPAAPSASLVTYSDSEEEEEEAAPAPAPAAKKGKKEAPAAKVTAAVAEAPAGSWFYGDAAGKVQGPFSLEQMVQWVKQGSLPANTPVVAQGSEDMVVLETVGVLAAALPAHVPRSAAAKAAIAAMVTTAGAGVAAAVEQGMAKGLAKKEKKGAAKAAAAQGDGLAACLGGKGGGKPAPEPAAEPAAAPEAAPEEAAAPASKKAKAKSPAKKPSAAEPEPEAEAEAAPAKKAAPAAKAAPAPEAAQESEEELSAMKVTELKALCLERELSDKGKKAELVARLLG